MHLHSCPKEVLERGKVTWALGEAVRAGKVRVAAYSGENEALAYAISSLSKAERAGAPGEVVGSPGGAAGASGEAAGSPGGAGVSGGAGAPGEVVGAPGEVVGSPGGAGVSGEVADAPGEAGPAGGFGAVQCSVNLCDQRGLYALLPEAARRGLGVIAKRPLANVPWRFAERPAGHYAEVYWERMRAMDLLSQELGGMPLDEVFLRFAAHAPGVSACIVGTASLAHLHRAVEAVSRGPLPPALFDKLRELFRRQGHEWTGQV